MSGIKVFKAAQAAPEFTSGVSRVPVLAGEYKDVAFYQYIVKAGACVEPELYAFGDKCQLFFFAGGTGYITTPRDAYNIKEPSLFVPDFDKEKFTIHSTGDLVFLQIIPNLSDYDRADMTGTHITLPRFRPLSQAWTYQEHFKTPGVTSYMMIEHRNLGRLSMGVVTGGGPGVVGQHIHNELQQWYYALPGADYTCVSGEEEFDVQGGDLCYFPMGTYHGSKVEAGKRFDYMWFELCEDGYPGQIL
jgi:quercetin dioxygenase-like cupin family protein